MCFRQIHPLLHSHDLFFPNSLLSNFKFCCSFSLSFDGCLRSFHTKLSLTLVKDVLQLLKWSVQCSLFLNLLEYLFTDNIYVCACAFANYKKAPSPVIKNENTKKCFLRWEEWSLHSWFRFPLCFEPSFCHSLSLPFRIPGNLSIIINQDLCQGGEMLYDHALSLSCSSRRRSDRKGLLK